MISIAPSFPSSEAAAPEDYLNGFQVFTVINSLSPKRLSFVELHVLDHCLLESDISLTEDIECISSRR